MNPRDEAASFLEELGITELPIVPVEICRRLGIHYIEEQLSDLDGYLILDPANGGSLICVNNRIIEQGRKNFTVAHELGHFCMDGLNRKAFYCSSEVIESFKTTLDSVEGRANEFASELLMPRNIYQPLVKKLEPGWDAMICELRAMSFFIVLPAFVCCVQSTAIDHDVHWLVSRHAMLHRPPHPSTRKTYQVSLARVVI